ncbi:unnamed protein product [Meganyctiphanes norvegica]|uniref:C2H2-type domain-containing protein n=1 Tax=Meganyctiphanes norvegica TaxID=48144 RepID=A0AAV2S4W2_MEGNR
MNLVTFIPRDIDPEQILLKDPMLKTREDRKRERELVKKLQKKDQNKLYYRRKKSCNEARKLYYSEKGESKEKKKQRYSEYEAKKRDYYDLKIYLASEDRKDKEKAKEVIKTSIAETNDDEYDPTSAPLLDLDENLDTNENEVPDDDDAPYSPTGSPLLSKEAPYSPSGSPLLSKREYTVDLDESFTPKKLEKNKSVNKLDIDIKKCIIESSSFLHDEQDLKNIMTSISSYMDKMKESSPSNSSLDTLVPSNQSSETQPVESDITRTPLQPTINMIKSLQPSKSHDHSETQEILPPVSRSNTDVPKSSDLNSPLIESSVFTISSDLPVLLSPSSLQSSDKPPIPPSLPPPPNIIPHMLPLPPPPPPPMFAIQKIMDPRLRALDNDSTSHSQEKNSKIPMEIDSDSELESVKNFDYDDTDSNKTSDCVKRKFDEIETNNESNKKTKTCDEISSEKNKFTANQIFASVDENLEDSKDDFDFLKSFGISKDVVKESKEMGMTEMLNADYETWNRSSQFNNILSKLMSDDEQQKIHSSSTGDFKGLVIPSVEENSSIRVPEIEELDDVTGYKITEATEDLEKGDSSKNPPKKLFSEDELLESLAATELEVVYSKVTAKNPTTKFFTWDEVPPFYEKTPLVQPTIDKHQELPLVGIQYVLEVLPSPNATLEKCYYICAICSKKMTQTTLIAHIKSVPHRLKFSESHCKDIFARFGTIDLKTWTAPLVKEFTQALSKVESNTSQRRLAVALERDMSVVLGALKERIAKVSQYG